MMTFDELMAYVGVKIPDLVAGAGGGVVKALVFQRDHPLETIISGIVGGLTANYLGETAFSKAQNWNLDIGRGAACFVVGLTAMVICQTLMDLAKRWRKSANDAT